MVFQRNRLAYVPLVLFISIVTATAQCTATDLKSAQNNDAVVISNDGYKMVFYTVPRRTVTMNQTPTEIMLALGLEDHMVGTAFLDDKILPRLASAYQRIPVLSEKYPSKEILLSAEPDFIYGGFASAFFTSRGLCTREELLALNINSYLSPSHGSDKKLRPDPWTVAALYHEIRDIGKIFRIEKRAEALIDEIKNELSQAHALKTVRTKKPVVLWLDNFDENGPYIGGGDGSSNEIIRLAGGINAFAEVAGSWATVSKEQIVEKNIDFIVLVEMAWNSAAEKINILKSDSVYAQLDAVANNKFVTIDFSASTPGIRLPSAVKTLTVALYGN